MNFLQSIASAFYKKEGAGLSEYCFVFPNRRAGLFFQRAVGVVAEEPLFSPRITTINDLFVELSGLGQIDRIESQVILWKLYNKISSNKESFDEFVFWGDVILADFDDVDKYLADAAMLFANIKDLKEIESDYTFLSQRQLEAVKLFWTNFLPVGNSENKQKFKSVWAVLSPLYDEFKEELEARSLGYEGMIYRRVATIIKERNTGNNPHFEKLFKYKKVVFIGFNAINPCEKILMNYLKNSGSADFYWDYEGELIKDPANRASLFMEENIDMFPSSLELDSEHYPICEIEVTGIPSSSGQAKRVMNILKDVGGGINSAVILPDESMLMPVLYSIPEEVEAVNITMGYPLKEGSVVSLIENILELQRGTTYYRRVLPVLRHNYVKTITKGVSSTLVDKIIKENMIYVGKWEFEIHPFLKLIFREVKEISLYLLEVLEYLNSSVELTSIEKEFVYSLYTTITRLKNLLPEVTPDTYIRILGQIINSTSIPFKGEPLNGLQIMGVLETRCLDFDNVIICSVNEGVFPGKSFSNSFIPANLRKGFSLPDLEYNDTVSAYLFYRLISRAKKVFLLYDTRSDGLKSGEVSRYIYQLKYHFCLPIKESMAIQKIELPEKRKIVIDKDKELITLLKKYYFPKGEKALSASAINTYISCPLRFYFQYLRGLQEEESVAEGVEADTFGSIFHKTMERLYFGFKGKIVTHSMLEELLESDEKRVEMALTESFRAVMNLKEIKGRNLLTYRLIWKYVRQTIFFDECITPFEYIDSERTVEREINFEENFSLKFKGIIDRLDKINGEKRIVDYKTGRGNLPDVSKGIEKLFSQKHEKGEEILLQMMLYVLIVNDKSLSFIEPYMLREIFKKRRDYKIIEPELLEDFTAQLGNKLKELFDPAVPFTQTDNEKNCDYCPFKIICR